MHTLLICLAGPMQSWGMVSRYSERDTATEPTKSGIIGLLCSALGRPISAPISDLTRLPLGIRVDREGKLRYDYQTAEDVVTADGNSKTVPSKRYYLADAVFLAGLECADALFLESIGLALKQPAWQVSLGRKSYVPSRPLFIVSRPASIPGHPTIGGIVNQPLREALASFPPLCEPERGAERLRLVIETGDGPILRKDVPVSFESREFLTRRVVVEYMDILNRGGERDVVDETTAL